MLSRIPNTALATKENFEHHFRKERLQRFTCNREGSDVLNPPIEKGAFLFLATNFRFEGFVSVYFWSNLKADQDEHDHIGCNHFHNIGINFHEVSIR